MFDKDIEPLFQEFKIQPQQHLGSEVGDFGIDQDGFLYWTVADCFVHKKEAGPIRGFLKITWCSWNHKVYISGNGDNDRRCKGWDLMARIVDTSAIGGGSDQEL